MTAHTVLYTIHYTLYTYTIHTNMHTHTIRIRAESMRLPDYTTISWQASEARSAVLVGIESEFHSFKLEKNCKTKNATATATVTVTVTVIVER